MNKNIHLYSMKAICLLFLFYGSLYARDIQKSIDMKIETKKYELSKRSTSPDSSVVFISSKINPDFLHLEQILMDSTDISDGEVVFNRPVGVYKQEVSQCTSERGPVRISLDGLTLSVATDSFPVRVLCWDDSATYYEAYITYKSDE